MKFAVVLAATVLLMSPLAPQIATCQQQDSASKADYPPLVGSGSIVRFLVRGDRHVYSGPLSRLTSDSVVLEKCFRCSPNSYAREEISDLEVYRGSSYGRNMLFGFLGGAVIAGGLTALIVGSQSCNGDLCGLRYMAIPFATLGGGVTGLLIGIARGSETWDPIR
jgi:hypothetical protein